VAVVGARAKIAAPSGKTDNLTTVLRCPAAQPDATDPMKLHADKPDQLSVTAHGDGWIAVNGERHSASVVLLASGTVRPWGVARLEELTAEHFSALIEGDGPPPELLLLGSGTRLRFVAPALLRPLIERRIGVETMDTPAACRTFNILAGEGRRVVAALLIEA
jgi:uncharacterized protein